MNAAAMVTAVIRCRQPLLCMAAVVLVVLAGCSGVMPESDDNRDPYSVDDELDPEPENESAGNEAPDYLTSGLTADGIENVSLLLDHHFEVLERESGDGTYTVVESSNTSRNETVVRETQDRTVVSYPTGWRNTFTRTAYEDNATTTAVHDHWANETDWLTRVDSGNNSTRYEGGTHSEQPGHPPALDLRMEMMLSVVAGDDENVTVEERAHNGSTWYVLTRETDSETDTSRGDTVTVHIREDGFIDRIDGYSTRETWNTGDEVTEASQTHITFKIATDGTIDRPNWYEEAREATSDTDE